MNELTFFYMFMVLFCSEDWKFTIKRSMSPPPLGIILYNFCTLAEILICGLIIYMSFNFGFVYILSFLLFPLSWCVCPYIKATITNLMKAGDIFYDLLCVIAIPFFLYMVYMQLD